MSERSCYLLSMNNTSDKKLIILDKALYMVRNMGFESMSISTLAKEVGMSKSGLFAHFSSKEKMHLMILDHAAQTFSEDVFQKSFSRARGLPRLKTIMNNWYTWYQAEGGGTCPFIAASIEYDKKSGPVKEALRAHTQTLIESLVTSVDHCIEEKDFAPKTDSTKVAYELYSYICGALVFSRTLEYKKPLALFKRSVADLIKNYSA